MKLSSHSKSNFADLFVKAQFDPPFEPPDRPEMGSPDLLKDDILIELNERTGEYKVTDKQSVIKNFDKIKALLPDFEEVDDLILSPEDPEKAIKIMSEYWGEEVVAEILDKLGILYEEKIPSEDDIRGMHEDRRYDEWVDDRL